MDNINNKNYVINNVIATKRLLKACNYQNINNIIFSSTVSVYKETNRKIKKALLKPNNIYGLTKLRSENLITKNSKSNKVNYIILDF